MLTHKIIRQQFRYAPLYYKPIVLVYIFTVLMILVKVGMIRQGTVTFLDVYFRWFDAYLLGLVFLPMSAIISLMTLGFRSYDYLLGGSRKVLYQQILVQSLLVQTAIWLPWSMITLISSYTFDIVSNYQAWIVIILSTVEVFFNQVFLLVMGLVGYVITKSKTVGLMIIVGLNMLLFSLYLTKHVTPFWKFTLSQSPLTKFTNVLILGLILWVLLSILLAIIKNRDY